MPTSRLIASTSPLRRLRASRRAMPERLRVLLPHDGYHAQRESARALRALGHHVISVKLGENGESGDTSSNLNLLLCAIVEHRPDMLLSINYTGFDRAHFMDEVLEATGLPTALWFVDNPFVLAMGWMPPVPEVTSLFSWDRSFVPVLQDLGATSVHHLPLGTDAELFTPGPMRPEHHQALGFVGHSLGILEGRWGKRLTAPEMARAQAMAQVLLQDRQRLHTLVPEPQAPIDRETMVLACACVLASKAYRLECLRALPAYQLSITGDAHWAELIPGARLLGTTAYGEQLVQTYRDTAVSVNATNLQMPTTVNQRLFDVPAAGGFLITDHQAEMDDLFDVGEEMHTYRDAAELATLARHYLRHPEERAQMVARARDRVLRCHTYAHRMAQMVATMRRIHAHPAAGALPSARLGAGAARPSA